MADRLLRVEEVAALLSVSRWFVYDHGEELGLVKIGGTNRYCLERVEQYVAERAAVTERFSRPRPPPQPARPRSRRIPLIETSR